MKLTGFDEQEVAQNREKFLRKFSSTPEASVLVQINYDSDNFCRYAVVNEASAGEGIVWSGRTADALATKQKGLALFLPLADCGGVVLFDPKNQALMLSHLGRHSLEQNGALESVEFMQQQFGSNPNDLIVAISPVAARETYPLYAFENRGIDEVIINQLTMAGVNTERITPPSSYTTSDPNFYSHSEFLAGRQKDDGRFAMVAMLT